MTQYDEQKADEWSSAIVKQRNNSKDDLGDEISRREGEMKTQRDVEENNKYVPQEMGLPMRFDDHDDSILAINCKFQIFLKVLGSALLILLYKIIHKTVDIPDLYEGPYIQERESRPNHIYFKSSYYLFKFRSPFFCIDRDGT